MNIKENLQSQVQNLQKQVTDIKNEMQRQEDELKREMESKQDELFSSQLMERERRMTMIAEEGNKKKDQLIDSLKADVFSLKAL